MEWQTLSSLFAIILKSMRSVKSKEVMTSHSVLKRLETNRSTHHLLVFGLVPSICHPVELVSISWHVSARSLCCRAEMLLDGHILMTFGNNSRDGILSQSCQSKLNKDFGCIIQVLYQAKNLKTLMS